MGVYCTSKVNDTKANGIKDYHACFQKFGECNKNNLQTLQKISNVNIPNFTRKCVTIDFLAKLRW